MLNEMLNVAAWLAFQKRALLIIITSIQSKSAHKATWRDPAIVRGCGFQSAGSRGEREQRWQQLVGASGRALLRPGNYRLCRTIKTELGGSGVTLRSEVKCGDR